MRVRVRRNFRYESNELKECAEYKCLFKYIQLLNKHRPFQRNIRDSHDVIAYMMILMNSISGKKLLEFKTGIFRSLCFKR